MTKVNSPSVIKISGKEKNERIGRNTAFSSPNTIDAKSAVLKFLIVIPGKSAAVP